MEGTHKLVRQFRGIKLLRYPVVAALDSGLTEVLVVTSNELPQVAAAVDDLPVRFVTNESAEEGIASSIRSGLAALTIDCEGVLILLGDMPMVGACHLTALIERFDSARGKSVVVPEYEGRRGNPILWPRHQFPRLQQLQGDRGARELLALLSDEVIRLSMPDTGVLIDLDTPDDWAVWQSAQVGDPRAIHRVAI